jgi:hypothetical protein
MITSTMACTLLLLLPSLEVLSTMLDDFDWPDEEIIRPYQVIAEHNKHIKQLRLMLDSVFYLMLQQSVS